MRKQIQPLKKWKVIRVWIVNATTAMGALKLAKAKRHSRVIIQNIKENSWDGELD
jgi:LPS O-antigen subunit length determinant protein (WzzB/FepE family)